MQQNIPSEISKVSQAIVSPLLPNTNLPLEVVCLVLSKLPIENLERLWVFNQDWFILIKALCLDFYRSAFQESTLWTYLPQNPSAQNITLFPYFGQFLDGSWTTKLASEDYVNLEKLLVSQGMGSAALDDLLVGIDRTILFEEEKYLIQQRQLTNAETITDFLANHPSTWLKTVKAYRHIETTVNLLLLSLFIFTDRTLATESIFLILDTRLTYWLTGSGLDELNRHTLHKKLLLSHLIDFALGEGELFLKCPSEKQPVYQQNAKDLLYRLTDDNCRALLGSQCLVLVSAIKRRCFPIIDCFGPRALDRVIEEHPEDEMLLLVLLERLGGGRLSNALTEISLKSFPKVVNECPQFICQLLVTLTVEQMCNMLKQLLTAQVVCLLNHQAFIDFFKALDAQQKELMKNTSSKKIAITCSPSELLLHFYKAQPDHKTEIISSPLAEYLEPREILVILQEEETPFWNSFPQSSLLQKFTQLNDFIELYLKYEDYCKQPRYSRPEVKFPEEILYKWMAFGKEKIQISHPDPLDLLYWDISVGEKKGSLFYKPTSLTCTKLEQAKQACISGVHVKLQGRINHLWEQRKQIEERPAKVILSWSSESARDILILLRNEDEDVWNLFPQSNLLDKFTEINDFIELYSMYNTDLDIQFPKEITLKCGQYVREKIFVPNPDPLDFIFWKIVNKAYWDKLSCGELELALGTCVFGVHAILGKEISCLWAQKKAEERAAQVILSWSSKSAGEILVLLRDQDKKVWNLFPKSGLIDKFTEINDFIELYLMYEANSKVQFPQELTLTRDQYKAKMSHPELLDFVYWKVFNSASYWNNLSLTTLELARLNCAQGVHVALLEKINRLWALKEAEEPEKSSFESTEESSTDDSQDPDETFVLEEDVEDAALRETAASSEATNENLRPPVFISPEVPQIPEPSAGSLEPIFLRPEEPQSFIPIITYPQVEVSIPTQSNDLTPIQEPTVVAELSLPSQTGPASQQPIPARLNHNPPLQESTAMNIAWSIAKGLFIGLLVMGIVILLLMFVNYEFDVLLMNTLLDNVLIGGIAGAFAWVVATACFLADANICATSHANDTNEADNPIHPHIIPIQNVQTAHGFDPSNSSQPFFADSAVDTSIPHVNQTLKTPF